MRFALVLTVATLLWSVQLSAQTPSAAPAGNAENGKKLWVERACYQCHGYVAQGGAGEAPRLSGRVPPWAAFTTFLRTPADQMIPYTKKVLPDQEAADIYAWLKSLPPPPSVSSIPELK
jgi:mono/diheme cytochrome c family protein